MTQNLSLRDLYNKLLKQQELYGQKIEYLNSLFSGTLQFPSGVTNTNDSPGLWPDTGINVFAILAEYNLAQSFCTNGTLLNVGMGRHKYQVMVVQSNEIYPLMNGKLYYRYAKENDNEWSEWKRFVYAYELMGDNGKDDKGKAITDTEDEVPSKNIHNLGKGGHDGADSDVDSTSPIIGGNKPNDTTSSMGLGDFSVAKAHIADQLSVARDISLAGAIKGNAIFDGSEDITIETSIEKIMPLNIKLDEFRSEAPTYRLLCTLQKPTQDSVDWVSIYGHIGAWRNMDGKATIIVSASNRDDAFLNGFVVGTLGACDIVAYRSPEGVLQIYLETKALQYQDDVQLSIICSKSVVIDNVVRMLDPACKKVWSLQENSVRVEGNKIFGEIVGNTGEAVHSTSSDKIRVKADTKRSAYLLGAVTFGDANEVICNQNIKIEANTNSITASCFNGDLHGTADNVLTDNDNMSKGYLLAAQGNRSNTPFYDSGVFVTTNPGELHANTIDCSAISVDVLQVDKELHVNDKVYFNNVMRMGDVVLGNNSIYLGDYPNNKMHGVDDTHVVLKSDFTATKVHNAWDINVTPQQDTAVYYLTASNNMSGVSALTTNRKVRLYADTGAISANYFVGSLQGLSDMAQSVQANQQNRQKGYLLGVSGSPAVIRGYNATDEGKNYMTPYYDDGIYLTENAGEMHIASLDAPVIKTTTVNAQGNITVNGVIEANDGINIQSGKRLCFSQGNNSSMWYNNNAIVTDCNFSANTGFYSNNDIAEYFEKGEPDITAGDIVMLDINATEEQYIKAQEHCGDYIAGVVSDSYGVVLGANKQQDNSFIPVALAGRVFVKFKGISRKGGKVVCGGDGIGRLYDSNIDEKEDIVGYLVQSDDKTNLRTLRMRVR